MLTIFKWVSGIVAGLSFLVLLIQVLLFFRAVRARMTGRIPSGEIMIDFGRGPTDAITWYVCHYLLGILGTIVTAWIITEPFFPEAWQVPMQTDWGVALVLLAAGFGAFWGSAMCLKHCGDFDSNLRSFGA